jgi:DNA-binding CsgD family transcriptional regulator
MMWIRESFDDGIRDRASGADTLAALAERTAADGDVDLAMKLLWGAARRCFWSEPGASTRERVLRAAERMPIGELDARMIAVLAFAAPLERGAVVVDRLARLPLLEDPEMSRLLGSAAILVGDFDLAARLSAASLSGLRAHGRLGLLARALSAQAWATVQLVDLSVAIPAAEEANRLTSETAQPLMRAITQATQAMLAALRGQPALVEDFASQAEAQAMPVTARPVLAGVQAARGMSALVEGRYAEAYEHLRRMHDRADPAYHDALRCYSIVDLVEAAVRSGNTGDVAPVVEEMEQIASNTPSPALHAGLRQARALLADDASAEQLFHAALGVDLTRLPFIRARAQLAYGEWLRRQRRSADSRAPLRAAREAFDALGSLPWSERARQELRASGEVSRRRTPEARDQLTAQELQIAQLAAAGLTNREIGEKLYLSHRTIGSHLYRAFPKLGITSRIELAAVVAPSI